jgi:hypothetical protein
MINIYLSTRFRFFFSLRSTNDKTDIDIIRNEHRFLWDEEEDAPGETWYREFQLYLFGLMC